MTNIRMLSPIWQVPGTFHLQIAFIKKAFVMKIILLIQILAGVEFLRSCSASSDK